MYKVYLRVQYRIDVLHLRSLVRRVCGSDGIRLYSTKWLLGESGQKGKNGRDHLEWQEGMSLSEW